ERPGARAIEALPQAGVRTTDKEKIAAEKFAPMDSGSVPLLNSFEYLLQLLMRRTGVFPRIVAIPFPPEHAPDHAEHAEQEKRHSPTGERHDRDHQWRRKRAAEARPHEQDTVSIADLAARKPSRKTSRDGRERAGFADAEEASCHQENSKVPRQSCGRSKCH